MAGSITLTKANLIQCKHSLSLSKLGYDLLDRKRNIMVKEMMEMIDKATAIQNTIDTTFAEAYHALQQANFTLGLSNVEILATAVPIETDVTIRYKSIMGVEIPVVSIDKDAVKIHYGFSSSNSMLDEAYIRFLKVKELAVLIAEIENGVYKLADNIKKTQKRANALKNIIIPRYESMVKYISEGLAEKEREEFSRLKVIKRQKTVR